MYYILVLISPIHCCLTAKIEFTYNQINCQVKRVQVKALYNSTVFSLNAIMLIKTISKIASAVSVAAELAVVTISDSINPIIYSKRHWFYV